MHLRVRKLQDGDGEVTSIAMAEALEMLARTDGHVLTVLHDDGEYRHLRFQHPSGHRLYWSEVETTPGRCTVVVDGFTYTFRGTLAEIAEPDAGPDYWASRLAPNHRATARQYSPIVCQRAIADHLSNALEHDQPPGLEMAARRALLKEQFFSEQEAREAIVAFEHEGFRFENAWDWPLTDFDPAYLFGFLSLRHIARRYLAGPSA
jgi:hypothetical protein